MFQKKLKIAVCSPSFRNSQHLESRVQLVLNKASALHIWITGITPESHLLSAKPSTKL